MIMLADDLEFGVGVDTHKDTHSIAVLDRAGGARCRGREVTSTL
jgi:hypothetical protein